MPTHTLTGANFTAYGPNDHVASVARTGESTSYASGDDYAHQSGVSWPVTRFTDNADGTANDHLSGLIWLKEAGCMTVNDWSTALAVAAQLANGNCIVSEYYSTSTTYAPDPTQAWTVYSRDFGVYQPAKSEVHYALAVR